MLTEIVSAEPLDNYRLHLSFDDGSQGVVDIAKLIRFEGVFEQLRDENYFRMVRLDPELGTVVWPSGADLDPLVLWSVLTDRPIELGHNSFPLFLP